MPLATHQHLPRLTLAFTRPLTYQHIYIYAFRTQKLVTPYFSRQSQKLWHREAFAPQRIFYTEKLWCTEKLLLHRRFYTHTEAFTHTRLYTQSFYAQKPLHTDAFIPTEKPIPQSSFYTLHFQKSQFYVSFWRSAIISCERVASGVGKSQFLTLDNHFAWKGCAWPCKTAILHEFFSGETVVPDVSKWIKSQFYTNSWTFASDVKKSQFSHSYCRLTFMPRLHLNFQNHNFTPVFDGWPSFRAKGLCRAAQGLTKFACCHMFGCPTCAISAEGCPCPKEIHIAIPPRVWAFETHDLRRRLLRAKKFRISPHQHVCPSDTRDLRRGLPKDKQDPHYATRLGVRHAAEGNVS